MRWFFYHKMILNHLITKILSILVFITTIGSCAVATAKQAEPSTLTPLLQFYKQQHILPSSQFQLTYVTQTALPQPYDFILTQPLMTLGIQQHYQRTPKVRAPLYVLNDTQTGTYSRAIIMVIDNNKKRNDALIADKLGQSTIVELGLITINFSALPQNVITGVLQSQTPFGALLDNNHIPTHDANTQYFTVNCNPVLTKLLRCNLIKPVYGRVNTLTRNDNGAWVAHVIEILSGAKKPS